MKKRWTTLITAVLVILILTATTLAVHEWKKYRRLCEVIEQLDSISQERKMMLEERSKELEALLGDTIMPLLESDEAADKKIRVMLPHEPMKKSLGMPQPR